MNQSNSVADANCECGKKVAKLFTFKLQTEAQRICEMLINSLIF